MPMFMGNFVSVNRRHFVTEEWTAFFQYETGECFFGRGNTRTDAMIDAKRIARSWLKQKATKIKK